jgi:hypothetical protein
MLFSLGWVVVFVLDVIALASLLKTSADSTTKILWVLLILFLPIAGMVLYFFLGPGRRKII